MKHFQFMISLIDTFTIRSHMSLEAQTHFQLEQTCGDGLFRSTPTSEIGTNFRAGERGRERERNRQREDGHTRIRRWLLVLVEWFGSDGWGGWDEWGDLFKTLKFIGESCEMVFRRSRSPGVSGRRSGSRRPRWRWVRRSSRSECPPSPRACAATRRRPTSSRMQTNQPSAFLKWCHWLVSLPLFLFFFKKKFSRRGGQFVCFSTESTHSWWNINGFGERIQSNCLFFLSSPSLFLLCSTHGKVQRRPCRLHPFQIIPPWLSGRRPARCTVHLDHSLHFKLTDLSLRTCQSTRRTGRLPT